MTRMLSAPGRKGSLKMRQGRRMTSESSPGAWPVELPSKFHLGSDSTDAAYFVQCQSRQKARQTHKTERFKRVERQEGTGMMSKGTSEVVGCISPSTTRIRGRMMVIKWPIDMRATARFVQPPSNDTVSQSVSQSRHTVTHTDAQTQARTLDLGRVRVLERVLPSASTHTYSARMVSSG